MKWIRYRFYTKAEDYRPIIFNHRYPWWCSGETMDGKAIIVAYLPENESLFKYWDDAFNIDKEACEKIEFTERFPKPDYFVES